MSLRERREDIPILANAFASEFGRHYGKPDIALDSGAVEKLRHYSFPGNIRQLRHAVEKAVILADDNMLRAKDFTFDSSPVGLTVSPTGTIAEMEKKMIANAMVECGGNLSEVAARLGITRQTLYNKIKRMGL